ncbi:UDP-N-acetylmuramoyl-tripeptide--D-alanyl-D-alanine ligase [Aureibacter tunicatorum]|uniref:UDP-N-acetylmuramoyl-tripeptide--D-alanyl-D-alanine ligase n=1 Tax=Aureibacter tunicatorum TaxID=866807 RepID=A0AAE4BT16_9BACT|nr:UDP-N-acetylmuramoyl-tripeptide--D-alanyl-D-alanine ligase [Aureibacter tunicatorum]MDR6239007.1 UDP-N-acetylmuramoyl-tripeptide--D-alanyl-D-alanine ligase [Aureibacter tunicatorum]BDD05067.1 UDP-N-acetylmuramoyl-tripeptide--D-alanyl-D-alanine ligase [Aureibacter tunicatorum]
MYLQTEDILDRFLSSKGVTTDSRSIAEGQIFFALKGDNFNGNKYAKDALNKGATYAVIDEPEFQDDGRFLLVDNVLETLQDLARLHRRRFNIPVLGITGSNGKTTTKELLHEILDKKYNVLATKGNLNNHIGVPLTLLNLNPEHEFAIIEMGANKVGDIAELCSIAEPNYGIITNIGKAHIGPFGGFEGVIRAKSELYQYLITHKGTAFINADDPILFNMSKRFSNPILYRTEKSIFEPINNSDEDNLSYTFDNNIHKTNLIGSYNFKNISAGVCIGQHFGINPDDIFEAIDNYTPNNNRSQLITIDSNKVYLDAYNANPSSMEAAIQNLGKQNNSHTVAILGDMLELGKYSENEHNTIKDLLQSYKIDEGYLCGPEFHKFVKPSDNIMIFDSKDELEAYLKTKKFENSIILIKASRGIGLETLINVL